jgi:hypothetical protein
MWCRETGTNLGFGLRGCRSDQLGAKILMPCLQMTSSPLLHLPSTASLQHPSLCSNASSYRKTKSEIESSWKWQVTKTGKEGFIHCKGPLSPSLVLFRSAICTMGITRLQLWAREATAKQGGEGGTHCWRNAAKMNIKSQSSSWNWKIWN